MISPGSPSVPAGPETAPTSSAVASPTPQSSSASTMYLSSASTASIAICLVLFGLAALAFVIYQRRRWRPPPKVSDERSLEKVVAGRDIEALAASHPTIPVTPAANVRRTPQIRSISGPVLDDKGSDRKNLKVSKRARSPSTDHQTSEPK